MKRACTRLSCRLAAANEIKKKRQDREGRGKHRAKTGEVVTASVVTGPVYHF